PLATPPWFQRLGQLPAVWQLVVGRAPLWGGRRTPVTGDRPVAGRRWHARDNFRLVPALLRAFPHPAQRAGSAPQPRRRVGPWGRCGTDRAAVSIRCGADR